MSTFKPFQPKDITLDELKHALEFDEESGCFLWKNPRIGLGCGQIAGHVRSSGYRVIILNYKVYYAHRLVWLWAYGEYPDFCVDHIDGDRANNRISNLRPATHKQNTQSKGKNKNNTSGFKGVVAAGKRWVAQIMCDGKTHYLGRFDRPEEAAIAHDIAAIKLFGKFARTNISLGMLS